jgi:hypothetical protein
MTKQTIHSAQAHLLRSAFYLLLVPVLCVIPSGLAQQLLITGTVVEPNTPGVAQSQLHALPDVAKFWDELTARNQISMTRN